MPQPVLSSGAAQPSSRAPAPDSGSILGASRAEDNETSSSPTRAASGSRNPAEVLRRLSLVDGDRPSTPDVDPRAAYPALNLSGRIISATFCIPHSLGFRSGHEWVRRARAVSASLCSQPNRKSAVVGARQHCLTHSSIFRSPTGHGTTRWSDGPERSSRKRRRWAFLFRPVQIRASALH